MTYNRRCGIIIRKYGERKKEEMNEKLAEVLKRFKEKTLKKCYKIELIEGTPELTDSKIGGKPYLPKGMEYPKDNKGEAMPLLIQINLEGMQLENYPSKGLLQVYAGKSLDYPTEYKIMYFEDIAKEHNKELPEIDLSEFIVQESIKIQLIPNETYMPLGDYRFEETFSNLFNEVFGAKVESIFDIDEIVGEKNAYNEFLKALNIERGLIGGYADFTQTDPRSYEKEELQECILKLDSQLDNKRIWIGDAGILWILITEEDLKNKNFDKAELDWDCC